MAKNNGHWYTDKNGNHYFVENGQSPKEGWEESKRRKMISGGKYMTSEDGNDYSEVDKDKYDAYEADEADFDENVDDDFGFDEEMEISDEEKQEFIDQLVKDNYFQEGEIKDIKFNNDDDATIDITTDKGTKRYEYVGGRLFDHEGSNDDEYNDEDDGDDFEEEEKVRYLDKTYNRYFDSQENWKRNETGNYEIGDDENYGYVLNDGERPGMIRAGRVRNGDHEHPEEEFFEDPQEAKEWVEEVANGEYNREMKKAQEENANMSEGDDEPDETPEQKNYKQFKSEIERDKNDKQKLQKHLDNTNMVLKDIMNNPKDYEGLWNYNDLSNLKNTIENYIGKEGPQDLTDMGLGDYAPGMNLKHSEDELANNNYKAYEADIKRFTTKGQKLDLIQDIKEDDSLTQLQKNELINKIRNTQTTLNDDEQRERVSELEGDRLFNVDMKGGSQNYNYRDEGHYYKDGRWKPGNHRTGQWAPEYFGVYEKRSPDGIGYTEKEYRGDFPSLEKAQEFASKYQGKNPLNIGKFQLQSNGSYRNVENQEYKRQSTGTQGNQEKISKVKNLVDKGILSKEDWTRFMNGSLSDEELIKKILG